MECPTPLDSSHTLNYWTLISCSTRPNPKQLLASAPSENAMFSWQRRYGRKALQENAGKVLQ
eukprot:2751337-Rhodomonas_salina.1